jgi:hypothetical protein
MGVNFVQKVGIMRHLVQMMIQNAYLALKERTVK